MEVWFACLITLQFLVIVSHDWVNIPGWAHGRQVQEVVGRRKLGVATMIGAVFPGMAAGSALYFWNRRPPNGVVDYWVIYCAVTVASAVMMWWVPYLIGCDEGRRRDYARMYAGTLHVLPPRGARGDHPRPNLLHLFFHALFAVTLVLGLMMRFGGG